MIYLLIGSNHTEKKAFIKKLTSKIPKEEISVYFADETEASVIFSDCYQSSLFGSQNVVEVRNVSSIKDAGRKKEFNLALVHYIEHANPDTLLIVSMENVAATVKKAIKDKKNIQVKDFKKIWHKDLVKFTRDFFNRQKIGIDPVIAEFLVEMCNDNQEELTMTCSLLVNYAGEEKFLHFENLRKFLKRSHTMTVFDVIDGIFEKDPKRGVQAIEDLRLQKEPILRLNALILRTARLMWHYLTLHDKSNLTGDLGIKAFEAKRITLYGRVNTLKDISAVFSLIRRVEWIVKTESEDLAWLTLESYLSRLEGVLS